MHTSYWCSNCEKWKNAMSDGQNIQIERIDCPVCGNKLYQGKMRVNTKGMMLLLGGLAMILQLPVVLARRFFDWIFVLNFLLRLVTSEYSSTQFVLSLGFFFIGVGLVAGAVYGKMYMLTWEWSDYPPLNAPRPSFRNQLRLGLPSAILLTFLILLFLNSVVSFLQYFILLR